MNESIIGLRSEGIILVTVKEEPILFKYSKLAWELARQSRIVC